jgi:hypothetical protein
MEKSCCRLQLDFVDTMLVPSKRAVATETSTGTLETSTRTEVEHAESNGISLSEVVHHETFLAGPRLFEHHDALIIEPDPVSPIIQMNRVAKSRTHAPCR